MAGISKVVNKIKGWIHDEQENFLRNFLSWMPEADYGVWFSLFTCLSLSLSLSPLLDIWIAF